MPSFSTLWEGKHPETLLGNRLPMLYKQLFKQIMKICQYLLQHYLEVNEIFSNLIVSLWKEVTPVVQFGSVWTRNDFPVFSQYLVICSYLCGSLKRLEIWERKKQWASSVARMQGVTWGCRWGAAHQGRQAREEGDSWARALPGEVTSRVRQVHHISRDQPQPSMTHKRPDHESWPELDWGSQSYGQGSGCLGQCRLLVPSGPW